MSYIHTDGVEYSDDKKTLVSCPEEATEITILDSVTSIGEFAFSGCSGLPSIVIPDGVTSIGKDAFWDCSGLTSIVIPDSVTSIGVYAFSGCSGITSISVDANNPRYDSRNNCNAIIETKTNTLIAGCKNTIIPDSVTSIGKYAFYGCSELTSIVIPDGVTSIEYGAFYGCSGLTSIVILDGVTSIGKDAFSDCSGLTSIVIPDSVTSIGEWAFSDCSGLTSIVIPDSVTSIGEWAFSDCGLKEICIPKGTRDKFCAMPELKKYENLLVEYKKEEKEKCATPESE